MRISLACYSMRLREKGSDVYRLLGDLGDKETLFEAFLQYFRELKEDHTDDPDIQKLLRVTKLRRMKGGRLIRGLVDAGRYGMGADLVNVEERRVTYRRSPIEAELTPYYFLVDAPSGGDTGILLLQRRGSIGIRGDFLDDFVKDLGIRHPSVRLELNPLMPPDLLNDYLGNGQFTKLRLIRHERPRDIANGVSGNGNDEGTERVEIAYSRGRRRRFRFHEPIVDVLRGKRRVEDLVEVVEFPGGTDFAYDGAKAELTIGGRCRTIDLFRPNKMRATHEITDNVALDSDGHPIFESIDSLAKSLRRKLIKQLGEAVA